MIEMPQKLLTPHDIFMTISSRFQIDDNFREKKEKSFYIYKLIFLTAEFE